MAALLIDMDGVLVDSVGYWSDARAAVIRTELGITEFDVSRLVGLNVHDEYELLRETRAVSLSVEEYVEKLDEYSTEIYRKKVTLLPGIRDVIIRASENGFSLGVVSASSRYRIEMVLDRFELTERFEFVIGADEIDGDSKPAPDLYRIAMDELGVNPGETIVVEDSVHGVMAATRAGAYCIRYDHEQTRGDANPHETVTDAEELRDRLLELLDQPPHLDEIRSEPSTVE